VQNVNNNTNGHFELGFEADCSDNFGFCGEDTAPGGVPKNAHASTNPKLSAADEKLLKVANANPIRVSGKVNGPPCNALCRLNAVLASWGIDARASESSVAPGAKSTGGGCHLIPCPLSLTDFTKPPPGFEWYKGRAWFFHCGFTGIQEDCDPDPHAAQDPANCQQECFYHNDPADPNFRKLVTKEDPSPDCFCRGTPNQYDSAASRWGHFSHDKGGPWKAGVESLLLGTIPHALGLAPPTGPEEWGMFVRNFPFAP
jgi:hypothetical protein